MKNRIPPTKASIIMASVMALYSTASSANQYKELTLEKKVADSNLVLIGQVTATSRSRCLNLNSCAEIKIFDLLKGTKPGNISILFDGAMAEEDPICCEVGSTYIFFLKHVSGPYYESVNGPYGIYKTN